MIRSRRIGALDIAGVISERVGSYVDMNFIEFLAVDGNHIQCWYMNSGADGPTFQIDLKRDGEEWTLELEELPAGTEQDVEVP